MVYDFFYKKSNYLEGDRGNSWQMERIPMVGQQERKDTLQQRVGDLLRGAPSAQVTVETGIEAVDSLHQALLKEQATLEATQERVDRLLWELEKAKSQVS